VRENVKELNNEETMEADGEEEYSIAEEENDRKL